MNSPEKLDVPSWSLEQIKNQRLDGKQYSIGISDTYPSEKKLQLYGFRFGKLTNICEIKYELSQEEFETLLRSSNKIDSFVSDLIVLRAQISLYSAANKVDEVRYEDEDVERALKYLADPTNRPFRREGLPPELVDIFDIFKELMGINMIETEEQYQKRFEDYHQRITREPMAELFKAGQQSLAVDTNYDVTQVCQAELQPTYVSVKDELLGKIHENPVSIKKAIEEEYAKVRKNLLGTIEANQHTLPPSCS